MELTFNNFFNLAMDRKLEELVPAEPSELQSISYNLGAGKKKIHGSIPLDLPHWDADHQPIPAMNGTVSEIIAFHFLEHVKEPVKLLQECQRVLKQGGIMLICVPYYSAQIASQDLDHKHFFTENTWRTLFNNQYYDKNMIEWKFKIGFNLICGIEEKNLVLLTQLIKE